MEPAEILAREDFVVPAVEAADAGVAWLRGHVVRFSEGDDHRRRRAWVEARLAAVDLDALRRPGDHVATLAAALGLPPTVAADVRRVAASYQPHREVTPAADDALARLVDAAGGRWDEETANFIGLLVQGCDATANLFAGASPPVPSTRRISPDGDVVVVDLSDHPFGAGRHACPAQAHVLALAAGAGDRPHRAAAHAIVRAELADDPTIDITTTGRTTRQPRRIEIWMLDIDGRFFIMGTPGPRDWLANLRSDPRLTVHLKRRAGVDLAATALEVADDPTRRTVIDHVAAAWYRGESDLGDLVATAPMVEVQIHP